MDQEEENLKSYYSLRYVDYDLLYDKPDRQADLRGMEKVVKEVLTGKRVLEIACGTGYWTELLADHAESILATDINERMIEVARRRTRPKKNVSFLKSDAYDLEEVKGSFNAALCGYWISHVKRNRMREFLETLHSRLEPGSSVLLLDNRYVNTNITPISKTDREGNTYQMRKLSNGPPYEIVKNFLTDRDLIELTDGIGSNRRFHCFEHYWVFHYTI